MPMTLILLTVLLLLGILGMILLWRLTAQIGQPQDNLQLQESLNRQTERLLAVLADQDHRLQTSLASQHDRTQSSLSSQSEHMHAALRDHGEHMHAALLAHGEGLRKQLTEELSLLRASITSLQQTQNTELATLRADWQTAQTRFLADTLQQQAEYSRADRILLQNSLQQSSEQLAERIRELTTRVDTRLNEISGKVSERLDEGFKKTNETFVNVMARLATIDEAQKKIDGLTSNVISLQTLLGDKRSRGAFGEVQLEGLVRNILPPDTYRFQETLSNGTRADCLLMLPEPTGKVAIDAKFPLENWHRLNDQQLPEADRQLAMRNFKADIRKHVDDIAAKYIIPGETSDGAVMFVPAEAVFAEIHGSHADINEYAQKMRVWIVSPTTLMAVLNTARAVIKDVETRKQIHIIKEALGKLNKDFGLFDDRMRKLADHIRQAHEDAQKVHISSRKISQHFQRIESVELDQLQQPLAVLPDEEDNP